MHSHPSVVEVRKVSKRFGSVQALSDVSFALAGPQLLGILGPNGAGKTTLLDLIEGLAVPDAGEVRLFGAALRPYPRRRVGVVMQREFVMEGLSVGDYAELFAAIQRVHDGAARILRDAALETRASTPVARLSGGEASRLFLAAAIVHDPELILLDEPSAQLDPESKQRIGARLRELARERTVVLTTHDLREADALCDSLLFLVGGRVRAQGTRSELVAAVPEAERRGLAVEDAFFHFCALRMRRGELEEPEP